MDLVKAASTMTENMGHMCMECKRVFDTLRGERIHRAFAHGDTPEHGTLTRYRHGCRCAECGEANRLQKRHQRLYPTNPRAIDDSPETLKACLLAFGVEPEKLDEALTTRTIETAHWSAWRASGDLRKHCRCALPTEIAAEMRRAS